MSAEDQSARPQEAVSPEQLHRFREWQRENRQEILQIEQSNAQAVEKTILGIGAAVLGAVTVFPEHAARVAPDRLTLLVAAGILLCTGGASISILAAFVCSHRGLDERLEDLSRATPLTPAPPRRPEGYWSNRQRFFYMLAIGLFTGAIFLACVLALLHLTSATVERAPHLESAATAASVTDPQPSPPSTSKPRHRTTHRKDRTHD